MEHAIDSRNDRSMTKSLRTPVLALLALGLAVLGVGSARAADNALPFRAEFAGTVSPSVGTFTLAGNGRGTQLGGAGYSGSGVLAPDGMSDTLVETVTASDGSTLTIECRQSLEDLGDGVLQGTDAWTVIGGTGRFAQASGSGTGETFVYGLSTFHKKLTGTITLAY